VQDDSMSRSIGGSRHDHIVIQQLITGMRPVEDYTIYRSFVVPQKSKHSDRNTFSCQISCLHFVSVSYE